MDQHQVAAKLETESQEVLPLIQLISDLIERRCDKFLSTKYGLTMPQYELLLAAEKRSDVTLGGLSGELNCSRGNVTGIVDRLERDEWLKRERSKEDRRVISVRLTEKGSQVQDIETELSKEVQAMARVWDQAQLKTLSQLLLQIYHTLRD